MSRGELSIAKGTGNKFIKYLNQWFFQTEKLAENHVHRYSSHRSTRISDSFYYYV